ncbi:IS66 family transposase [Sphingobium sp. Ant17]|uniref:IS66 family transposase n=1 Tax=Sphingobium sp. Ant17 TaxID=1461752 RepID=UPI003FA79A16
MERDINGSPAAERHAVRQNPVSPRWSRSWVTGCVNSAGCSPLRTQSAKRWITCSNAWPAFTAFLEDGRICLTNNAAERALRAIARGRKAWLFVGSDRGGERAAMMYTPHRHLQTQRCRSPLWLTDVLTRIADISQNRLHELLPWTWKHLREKIDTAQAA